MNETVSSMRLRYIRRACHANNDFGSRMVKPVPSVRAGTSELIQDKAIYIRVRDKRDINGAVYICPVHIARSGSILLRSVLANRAAHGDAEGNTDEDDMYSNVVDMNVNDGIDDRWSGKHLATETDPYPIPYLTSDIFETVAIYLENFYGNTSYVANEHDGNTYRDTDVGAGSAMHDVMMTHSCNSAVQPTRLHSALGTCDTYAYYRALYCLSEWEQRFVLERLLQVPELLQYRQSCVSASTALSASPCPMSNTSSVVVVSSAFSSNDSSDDVRARLSHWMTNGVWIDALSMPYENDTGDKRSDNDARRVKSNTWTTPPVAEQTNNSCEPTASCSLSQDTAKEVYLTDSEKHVIIQRLCAVLESATQMGIPSLQSLCAACVAHILANRSETDILNSLLGTVSTPLAPFSSRAKAELQKEFPWAPLTAASNDDIVDTMLPTRVDNENFCEVNLH